MKTCSTIRLVLVPAAVTLLLLCVWVTILAVPGAFLLTAIYFASLPPAAIVIGPLSGAAALVLLFWWRHRVSGASMLCGLITVLALACVPTVATSPAKWMAEVAQDVRTSPSLFDKRPRSLLGRRAGGGALHGIRSKPLSTVAWF
jgi:hypothetical protein